MALATQCPHCKTTFRVAQDQLKLRAGLVRCGSCKEIFNGIEHLLAVDASAIQPVEAAQTVEQAESLPVPPPEKYIPEPANPLPEREPAPASDDLDFAYPDPEPPAVDEVEFIDFEVVPRQTTKTSIENVPAAVETHDEDPLQRMTLMDFNDTRPPEESDGADATQGEQEPVDSPDAPDPLDQAIEELKRKPLRGKKRAKTSVRRARAEIPGEASSTELQDADEPDFVKQGRRKQRMGRSLHVLIGVASFMLLLGALVQAVYTFRDQIAARFPDAKPVLLTACAAVHCRIGLPTQIEYISIESDELETLNTKKDDSVLTMLLRNGSAIVQAWPDIDLTLNDANGTMLARRVFVPREYLSTTQEATKGLSSNSEQTIKLYFEFSAAKPAGYHVGLFYP